MARAAGERLSSQTCELCARNEFTLLAQSYRGDIAVPDLLALAIRLAATPCSPLYSKHVSPDRELAALLRSFAPPTN